ncbi:Beta-galactosidase C-terminal domain [Thermus scotoductus]|uniref:Beta-galactosidase C-terminal domain n=1 Tax=Thermus scotoductus TaxID=37636 RepID=UPI0020A48528|nr:DUF3459 domain-containing protein [Thermus scotoductus]
MKHLLRLRQDPALPHGRYRTHQEANGLYADFRREGFLIALNFTDREKALDLPQEGRVALSTHLDREEAVRHTLRLRPHEGVVVRLG